MAVNPTYNSLEADTVGSAGFGWSTETDMRVISQGQNRVVVQENGTTVGFAPDGLGWKAPARLVATLAETPGGGWEFTRRHFERFVFDESGRLAEVRDQFGNETQYVRDGSGRVQYVDDSAGRRLVFGWVGARLDSVADHPSVGNRSIHFDYDTAGNLTSFVDVGGGLWSFSYDGDHQMVSMRRPAQQGGPADALIRNTYDHMGRVVEQLDALGQATRLSYSNPRPALPRSPTRLGANRSSSSMILVAAPSSQHRAASWSREVSYVA
ncbi:MAG: RHS repeat protein [Microthrixaceae bacterium]|nr:RHS repeat protein [Microthrixaceae bacterium]